MISPQDGDIFGWGLMIISLKLWMVASVQYIIYHKCTATADRAHICLQILLNDIPVVIGQQFIALQ